MHSFIQLFLIASFIYEFFQLLWNNKEYGLGYMVVSGFLLIVLFLIQGWASFKYLILFQLICWSLGLIILSFIQPYVTVFGYRMELWFIIPYTISLCIIILNNYRKRNVK
ncbi:hypothetical protein [Oceanobacillus senegalensis]|uniref:hypothetical protein n=1 Tax=Oceanobacillus senegalensis TaxID=1936063 RepID=UPI001C4F1371|nr:hypothetical protein [Oceanobacillus senegalensis]